MNYTNLNWSPIARNIWMHRKKEFEQRFSNMKWQEVIDGQVELPPAVALETQSYALKADLQNVKRIGYFISSDLQPVYCLEAEFNNGMASIYLHSNRGKIVVIATAFKPKIEIVSTLKVI